MQRSLPFPVHTHAHTQKKKASFSLLFSFFSFPASAVGPAGEGVGRGTRWEEWDETEGEEGSVCAWGDVVSSGEAIPVREITMVVICVIKKEGNTAEGMSLHSCEGLLITSPHKPTPPLTSAALHGRRTAKSLQKLAQSSCPQPPTAGTGAAWAKMHTQDTCHPLPAARTFILLTFLLLHGNYSF